MPLKPARALCETVRHKYHSKVWYAATEIGDGEALVTFRSKKECEAWVWSYNEQALRDAHDEVHYWRPRRVRAALEYLELRRRRQSQFVTEYGAQAELAF